MATTTLHLEVEVLDGFMLGFIAQLATDFRVASLAVLPDMEAAS